MCSVKSEGMTRSVPLSDFNDVRSRCIIDNDVWAYSIDLCRRTYILPSESGRGMYINSIGTKEKGQDFFYGPASVKIYYQKYGHPSYSITEVVDNRGEPLKRENFQVDWGDDENATVTISSEKSSPRTIKINVSERIPK